MKVILSPQAIDDLVEIGRYIGLDNPARARSYVSELKQACRELGTMPLRYPAAPRLGPNAHRRPFDCYLIFYDVTSVVQILTIVHARRDLDALFD